ncbi:MAG TPA: hypothetical protein VKL99_06905 [Candidatus Angelobacter sp.]|nr:hypothetical protein [Candidatus Angelobacter sp.]
MQNLPELRLNIQILRDHELSARRGARSGQRLGCKHNHGNRGELWVGVQDFNEMMPVQTGHLQVSENHVRTERFKGLQGLGAVVYSLHRKSLLFQETAQDVTDQHRIINDERK